MKNLQSQKKIRKKYRQNIEKQAFLGFGQMNLYCALPRQILK